MSSPRARNVASTARAFATYSLVPYLGILFCPGALLVGGFGIFRYRVDKLFAKRLLLERSCWRRGLDNPTLVVVDSLQGAYVGKGILSG